MVMASLCKQSSRSASIATSSATAGEYTFRNVVVAAGLALVLGLGWGFGLAASSHNINAVACTFQFLFSVFVSCQGLLLLFFHGIRNKDVKKVWRSWIGFCSKKYTLTVNMSGESGKIHSIGLNVVMKNHSSNDSSVPQEENSFSNPEKTAATDESVTNGPSLDSSHPLIDEKCAIEVQEKVASKKTIRRSFMSLSVLKKNAPEGIPSFRSDSQCAKHV